MLRDEISRTFLFRGATYDKDDEMVLASIEIVHCDGCGIKIKGTVMKCKNCFDFDLCGECFQNKSEMHFQGNHTFIAEST